MLKRANRVVTADQFRVAVRRGRCIGMPHALLYVSQVAETEPTRVGFIVSKAVGNAVKRNLVTRRLRSIGREVVLSQPTGTNLVIRALPGSPGVSWTTLQSEILMGLERSAAR